MKRWALTGIALLAGCLAGLGFAPYDCWWLVPIGLAGFILTCLRSTTKVGLLRGYVFGLGFNAVAFHWAAVLGLGVLAVFVAWLATWYALVGLVVAATRRTRAWGWCGVGAWMAVEWGGARWPFGGFGWGRLAYTAADSPLNGLYPFISATGVSLLIVTSGFLLAWVVRPWLVGRWGDDPPNPPHARLSPGRWGDDPPNPPRSLRSPRSWVSAIVTASVLVISCLGGLAGRSYDPAPTERSVTVAVVQGNVPGMGIEALGPPYTVENNHLAETIFLAAKIRTGQVAQPDFVVWPENSTATDPFQDTRTARIIDLALDLMDAPILVGAITRPEPGQRATVGLWYTPDEGMTASYQKRNLVPFGEWVPFQSFLIKLVPDLRYVGDQSIPGTTPGVLNVEAAGRPLRLGELICFEVAYDTTVDQMITGDSTTGGGAQVVVVQTSNAMFTGSDQMAQQDQITRIRAMETRREILVATTNSLAGLIDNHGRIVYEAQLRTSDSQVFTVPLRDVITPAVAWRNWIDLASVVLPLLIGFAVALRSRRSRDAIMGA